MKVFSIPLTSNKIFRQKSLKNTKQNKGENCGACFRVFASANLPLQKTNERLNKRVSKGSVCLVNFGDNILQLTQCGLCSQVSTYYASSLCYHNYLMLSLDQRDVLYGYTVNFETHHHPHARNFNQVYNHFRSFLWHMLHLIKLHSLKRSFTYNSHGVISLDT